MIKQFFRHIFAIWSVYFLFLGIQPCGDKPEASEKAVQTFSTKSDRPLHDNEVEGCPVFCACNCCGIHPIAPSHSYALMNDNPPIRDYHISEFQIESLPDTFWHPPQLQLS
ncbi:MAG TPA: hypothetical protein PLG25_01495 [bacterium]|nr:hypothetical protein [bacterium]